MFPREASITPPDFFSFFSFLSRFVSLIRSDELAAWLCFLFFQDLFRYRKKGGGACIARIKLSLLDLKHCAENYKPLPRPAEEHSAHKLAESYLHSVFAGIRRGSSSAPQLLEPLPQGKATKHRVKMLKGSEFEVSFAEDGYRPSCLHPSRVSQWDDRVPVILDTEVGCLNTDGTEVGERRR